MHPPYGLNYFRIILLDELVLLWTCYFNSTRGWIRPPYGLSNFRITLLDEPGLLWTLNVENVDSVHMVFLNNSSYYVIKYA